MNTRYCFRQTPLRLALAALAFGASVLGGHAGAATVTATASATVVAPIVITKGTDLAFGSFSSGTGGTVTISTSGVRSASGVALAPQGATPAAASFVVTGEQGASYGITHSGTTTLTRNSGPETMVLTKFSDLTASNTTTRSHMMRLVSLLSAPAPDTYTNTIRGFRRASVVATASVMS